ncbi:MAG: hypothetical protein E3J72_12320 [Planctomycetota bacterium]|nr:MAG: hypothetical protein E3J72_12320 [Planctomycetota bacterium]
MAFAAGTGSGTQIEFGGDRGIPGIADMPGDFIVTYRSGTASRAAFSNTITTTVASGFDLSVLPEPVDITTPPDEKVYYPYAITNNANCADQVSIEALNSGGGPWPLALINDNGMGNGTAADGIHQPGETDLLPPVVTLDPGESVHFFLEVSVPAGESDHAFSDNTVIVKNQNGAGAEDDWPSTNGRDSQSHQTTTTCVLTPLITINSVIPASISIGADATISWTANKNADFYVELGGNGARGTGLQLAEGKCDADVEIQTQISEGDLPDNGKSTLYVIIESVDGAAFASCEITDDQEAPVIELIRVTISGSITDSSVKTVMVNGTEHPVTDGKYSVTIEAPVGSEIEITAKSSSGYTATRKVRVTK